MPIDGSIDEKQTEPFCETLEMLGYWKHQEGRSREDDENREVI